MPHDFDGRLLSTCFRLHYTVVGVGGPVAGADRRERDIRAPADVIATPTHRMSDVIQVTMLTFSTLYLGARICQSTQTFVYM